MSRIEQAALPVMAPLMHGEPVLLDTLGQRLIASLLCLITIRAEFTNLATQAVPDSDSQWLRLKGEPGPSWRIWVARYGGENPEFHWHRQHGLQLVSSPDEGADEPPKCNTQVTTLVFGRLCAHTFSSTVDYDLRGYEGVRLSRIWPPTRFDIDWRRTALLSD